MDVFAFFIEFVFMMNIFQKIFRNPRFLTSFLLGAIDIEVVHACLAQIQGGIKNYQIIY